MLHEDYEASLVCVHVKMNSHQHCRHAVYLANLANTHQLQLIYAMPSTMLVIICMQIWAMHMTYLTQLDMGQLQVQPPASKLHPSPPAATVHLQRPHAHVHL